MGNIQTIVFFRDNGMENIQTNAIIEVPRMGISLEVQLPAIRMGTTEVYSMSGRKEDKVYLDTRLLNYNQVEKRHFTYSGDSLQTNGSWMQEQRGTRIC